MKSDLILSYIVVLIISVIYFDISLTSATTTVSDKETQDIIDKLSILSRDNGSVRLEHIIRHGRMKKLRRKYRLMENEPTSEDLRVQREWGGNCTAAHWAHCMTVRTISGRYWDSEADLKKGESNIKYNRTRSIDCNLLTGFCLWNTWTVNECHLLCMSKCNYDIIVHLFEKFVKHLGVCDYLS